VGDYNQIVKGGLGKDDGDKDSQVYSFEGNGVNEFWIETSVEFYVCIYI
jgi:hypothetical protein